MGRTGPGQTAGKLIQIGLAKRDRARGEQQADREGGPFRRITERRAGRRSRYAGQINIVLNRKRDAI